MDAQPQYNGSALRKLSVYIQRWNSAAQRVLMDGHQQADLDALQDATAIMLSEISGQEVASDHAEVVHIAGLRGEDLRTLLARVYALEALLADIEAARWQSGVLLANVGLLGQLLLAIFGGNVLWLVAGLAANLCQGLPRPVYTRGLRTHLAVEQLVLLAGLVSPIVKPFFERQTGVNISYAIPVALCAAGVVGTLVVVRNTPERIAADAAKLQEDFSNLRTKGIAARGLVQQLAPCTMLQQAAEQLAVDGDAMQESLVKLR